MGQSAVTATAIAEVTTRWQWDGVLVAMAASAGLLAATSVAFGAMGVRNAGILVARLPWLPRRPSRQAHAAAVAVTKPLAELKNVQVGLPKKEQVCAALRRRSQARQGATLRWAPVVVLAVVAAVIRPDPDLLVALVVVFPVLGCILSVDRAFDVRSNRRDHIAERAADALGMALALVRHRGSAGARHNAPARLPYHARRLCRALERAGGRGATSAMTRRLVAQIRYSTDRALAAESDEERRRERKHLVLVLASVLAFHTKSRFVHSLPVDPALIDDSAVAAIASSPRDGARFVVGGGLAVLFSVCAISYAAAQLPLPADALHFIAPSIAALGGYCLRRRRIPVVPGTAPSPPNGGSEKALEKD
ncbi:hypothetical protein [Catenulispora pinisilvae]|uniref:hypothetical protein n=1 Tax=Catenulispora pinisilvae TaxID=2705253 RepID=UPI0018914C45|nr:hypothetical protein [Catenulispora pinisilvae]